ncbi:MAG: hypothetical protein ACXV2C_06560, partial [Candidatus Bathyarchaeia archaeon]
MDLSSLIGEALRAPSEVFIKSAKAVTSLLQNETGQMGNITIANRLVTLEPLGEALVVGDLHGDLESLVIILQESHFLEVMEKN